MGNKHKIIFISWTNYNPHSQLLGKAFGADIYYINNFINSRGVLWKLLFFVDYFKKGIQTIKIIWTKKPNIVVVQNPPSIAPIIIFFLSMIKKFKLAVDSHNGAFEKPWVSLPLYKLALKHSDVIIVHNSQLFNELTNNLNFREVNFKILNSKLSGFPEVKKEKQNIPYILIISTFSPDEPMNNLLEGLRHFNQNNKLDIKFKITGNYNKKPLLHSEYSKDNNIEFLGFVSEDQYKYFLVNAFGVISLSTRDNVQQFSLMEAVGAEVPFISSNNRTNREIFGDKMVLTENISASISQSIDLFISERHNLQRNILVLKRDLSEKWDSDFKKIKKEVGI